MCEHRAVLILCTEQLECQSKLRTGGREDVGLCWGCTGDRYTPLCILSSVQKLFRYRYVLELRTLFYSTVNIRPVQQNLFYFKLFIQRRISSKRIWKMIRVFGIQHFENIFTRHPVDSDVFLVLLMLRNGLRKAYNLDFFQKSYFDKGFHILGIELFKLCFIC